MRFHCCISYLTPNLYSVIIFVIVFYLCYYRLNRFDFYVFLSHNCCFNTLETAVRDVIRNTRKSCLRDICIPNNVLSEIGIVYISNKHERLKSFFLKLKINKCFVILFRFQQIFRLHLVRAQRITIRSLKSLNKLIIFIRKLVLKNF